MAGGWNVLLYAIAGDDAERTRVLAAVDAMQRALSAERHGDRCGVVVQLHAKSKTTRHWLAAGQKIRVEAMPAVVDASEPTSLTSFLNAAHRALPLRSTALMLWAHTGGLDAVHDYPQKRASSPGGGALDRVFGEPPGLGGLATVDGVADLPLRAPPRESPEPAGCRWGPDPNTGEFLTNVGMKKAIAASARRRVELLGLNTCWMASLEIAYELRRVCDVQVASQVYAQPWPYGAIVAAVSAAPDLDTDGVARSIIGSVRAEIMASRRSDAVSALRSDAALDELATAFDAYARRVTTLIETDWEAVSKAVLVHTQRVDDPYQVDLMSLVHTLGKSDLKAKIAAASVDAKLRAVVVASAASVFHPNVYGVSVFCPRSPRVDLGAAYRGIEFHGNAWAQFLKAFQARLARQLN